MPIASTGPAGARVRYAADAQRPARATLQGAVGEITHGKLPGFLADVWAQERPLLMSVRRAFDGFVEHTKRFSLTCLVHLERNR